MFDELKSLIATITHTSRLVPGLNKKISQKASLRQLEKYEHGQELEFFFSGMERALWLY